MSIRWKTGLVLLLMLVAAGVVFRLAPPPEPTYRGRAISVWLDDWAAGKQTDCSAAIQEIGTNCLPYVARNLARNDSQWRTMYRELQPKVPTFLQKIVTAPKPVLRVVDGVNVFDWLGSNAIPEAITLLKHNSPAVRQASAWGLGSIRRQSSAANQAMPALIETLTDSDLDVRSYAVLALGEMRADASNAVPAIAKVLADTGGGSQTNSYLSLRASAALALGKIGPSAASGLPDLRSALKESDSYLRGQAAVAVWRVGGDVETALPVLLQVMPGTSEASKWDWIIALGEMGPRASEAVPQLMNELQQDKERWVLEYVTNALTKIAAGRLQRGVP